MRKLGNPFIPGSLSYVLVTLALGIFFGIYSLIDHENRHFSLGLCAVGIGAAASGWLKYSKLQYQKGHRFIGDD